MIGFLNIIQKTNNKILFLGGGICYILMLVALFQNSVNNGASRWVNIMGYSMQPSELLKPFLIVILAFLISKRNKVKIQSYAFRRKSFGFFNYDANKFFLIKQPNYSMVAILFFVLLSQLFIAGISFKLALSIIIYHCNYFNIFLFFISTCKNKSFRLCFFRKAQLSG